MWSVAKLLTPFVWFTTPCVIILLPLLLFPADIGKFLLPQSTSSKTPSFADESQRPAHFRWLQTQNFVLIDSITFICNNCSLNLGLFIFPFSQNATHLPSFKIWMKMTAGELVFHFVSGEQAAPVLLGCERPGGCWICGDFVQMACKLRKQWW